MTIVHDNLHVDAATESDVPLILQLIRELAEFEHLAHEVTASEESLRNGLFGERPYAEVFIARQGEEPVGFALFFHNFSTFVGKAGIYLEDLFVRREFRGQGVGEALLRRVAQTAVERACGRYEWAVLNWNQRAIDFYRKLGARPMDEWTIFRIAGEALNNLASGSLSPSAGEN